MTRAPVVRLADVTTKVGSGATPRGGEAAYQATGVPLIRSMNIHFDGLRREGLAYLDESQARTLSNVEVRAQDVLLNITGASIGRVAIAPPDMDGARVNQHVCIIRPDERLDPSFLRWYLAAPAMQRLIGGIESGATRQALTKEKILGFEIPLLPARAQRDIVAEIEKQFSRLDEAVANLQRVKANLVRYKLSVLRAATSGAILGNAQDEELPAGWKWAEIGELASVVRGASPRPAGDSKYFGGPVPWITVGPITADESDYLRTVPTGLTEAGRERSRYVEPHTLLLTNSGATLGVPKITLIGGCINDGVAALLGVDYPLKLYLLFYLRTKTAEMRMLNQGAAQPNLNTSIIKGYKVPVPPEADQHLIVSEVDRCLSTVRGVEAQVNANLKRARALRQSVLAYAFSCVATSSDTL